MIFNFFTDLDDDNFSCANFKTVWLQMEQFYLVRPPQTAIGRPAGTLLGSAPVPVAVFGVAPKTVFRRSADCPNPQRAARPTSIEIIPTVSRHATRCELGQLALRWKSPAPSGAAYL
jgi:hypothetical protein